MGTFLRLQFVDRLDDTQPNPLSIQVTLRKKIICSHRCMDRSIITILFYELVSRSIYVDA